MAAAAKPQSIDSRPETTFATCSTAAAAAAKSQPIVGRPETTYATRSAATAAAAATSPASCFTGRL